MRQRKQPGWAVFLGIGFLLLAQTGFARELQGRLGLGYNAQFANYSAASGGVPALSLKYALTRDFAVQALAGISTGTPSNSVFGAKLSRIFFHEPQLNFYGLLGGGLVAADSKSGIQVLTGFGAEFFIPGVDSLGFSMETGISADNLAGSFAIKTMGVSFINAGMHFYF